MHSVRKHLGLLSGHGRCTPPKFFAQALEDMQAKAADREMTAARLQDEKRKAALLAQVLLLVSPDVHTL